MKQNIIRTGLYFLSILFIARAFSACGILDFDAYKTPEMLIVRPDTETPDALQQTLLVTVICDLKWKVELSQTDWASVDNVFIGKDNMGKITLLLSPNTGNGPRTLGLTVTAGKGSRSVNIVQGGMDTYFSPSTITLSGTEVSSATFKSPSTWTAEVVSGKDWLALDTQKGYAGDATISCHALDPNENIGSREGSLKIDFGNVSVEIPVVQGQKDVILSDGSTASFDWKGGEFSVSTRTNVDYTIECSAPWVKHIETKALKEATESFVAEPNDTYADRQATVSFTGGDASFSVTVTQSGKDPYLDVNTPGFYGIAGMDYVLGTDGWNQAGRKEKDGSLELRLMKRSSYSAVIVSGIKTDAAEGSSANVDVVVKSGSKEVMHSVYNATVIAESDQLLWFKAEPGTCFIVKK